MAAIRKSKAGNRIGFWILVVVVGVVAVNWVATHRGTTTLADASTQTDSAPQPAPITKGHWTAALEHQFTDLRDEALADVGFVAGNAKGHAIWPQVRDYVDEDGQYTKFYESLATPREQQSDAEGQALLNIQTYEAGVGKGSAAAYDPSDDTDRAQRIVQIGTEIGAIMEKAK